ncbi:MAG: hypothetical protein HYS55_01365 [Candidatus Omnitrophica bacterium]|nr:hypothetical protein [Candidatus Omnitrophota bacterium]
MADQTQLLQFLVCRDFREEKQDFFTAESVHSNIYVHRFPATLKNFYVVTCWRKDEKFHKEVIEFETAYGEVIRTAHTDIEPISDSVLFRWHKHPFPEDFKIKESTTLTVRVYLDNQPRFESYLLIEKKS